MRRRSSPGVDDFRVIVAVAEERSFHRAGKKVGLSESGVSRAVSRVERYVGARIFERSHNRYHPVSTTEPGSRYIERIRPAIAHSESAASVARETQNGFLHHISVGRSVYTDERLIAIFHSMQTPLFPKLKVELVTKQPAELPACVRTGALDLAVVSNSPEDRDLNPTTVRCVPFIVMLPQEQRWTDKQAVTLADLAFMPWVLFERQIHPHLYDMFVNRARQRGIRVKRHFHISNAVEARELVRMFGGAAFLSPHGAEHAATNEVMLRPLDEKGIFLKTQLVVRSDNTSTLVDEFVRSFIKRLTHDGLYQPEVPHPVTGAVRAA